MNGKGDSKFEETPTKVGLKTKKKRNVVSEKGTHKPVQDGEEGEKRRILNGYVKV